MNTTDSARQSNDDWKPENLKLKYKSISQLLKGYDPSKIENRLPKVLFTGPNSLYNHRVPEVDYRHEIGIGEASRLRTLDIRYLTRGKSVNLSRRHNLPGEIGWSVSYFGGGSRASSSRPDSNYVPR